MSDIKLFGIKGSAPVELKGTSVALEKSLQSLIEAHLETFLGVRFLASEHGTGRVHAGRIDTLGIDENGCPVIIEYKRATNENVMNQGLFYLDWLMDHRGEFELLVLKTLGKAASEAIDWKSPRLLCIAGDYTRYDVHAVQQINRNIELVRYLQFGDDLLLLELVNTQRADTAEGKKEKPNSPKKAQTAKKDTKLADTFAGLRAHALAFGDDVTEKETKVYTAWRRLKNFICARPETDVVRVWLKVDPSSVKIEEGFSRDVREIGHHGTGDLELTLRTLDDLERAKPFILRSYEAS